MKHLKEKDLSLDKQVVSNLGGSDTNDKTDNELICASKVCTDSHFEICCAVSIEDTCPEKCPLVQSKDFCPATVDYNTCPCQETDESHCDACSDVQGCMIPLETVDC